MTSEKLYNTWFALCSNGKLALVGVHEDYESAEEGADNLGLDVIWLVCGDDARQWAYTINQVLVVETFN